MPQRAASLETVIKTIIITGLLLEKQSQTGTIKASQRVLCVWISFSFFCLTLCVIRILHRIEAIAAETVEHFQMVSF